MHECVYVCACVCDCVYTCTFMNCLGIIFKAKMDTLLELYISLLNLTHMNFISRIQIVVFVCMNYGMGATASSMFHLSSFVIVLLD